MKLTSFLSLWAIALVPHLTSAAPVPSPQGYASYGDYSAPEGGYGSYAGAGAAAGAAAPPAPPR